MYFLNQNKGKLGLVTDFALIDKLLKLDSDDWGSLEMELKSVVRDSSIGEKIFGDCIDGLVNQGIDKLIKDFMGNFPQVVTEKVIQDQCEKITEEVLSDLVSE